MLLKSLSHGYKSVVDKLITYARDQFPGGQYWNHVSATKETPSKLKPNNGFCLGLNNSLPMFQTSTSSMVQIKKVDHNLTTCQIQNKKML